MISYLGGMTQRTQTVLRLPEELFARVKRRARSEHRSFNSYVEHLLDKETELAFPKLEPDYKISDEILSLRGPGFKRPPQEVIDADPKLAYLVKKYGL